MLFFLILLLLILLVTGGYAGYLFIGDNRLDDNQTLEVVKPVSEKLEAGTTYKMMSYNIAYGVTDSQFSTFIEGGSGSKAKSEDIVRENMGKIEEQIAAYAPDIALLQAIDTDSKRSWNVNENAMLENYLEGYSHIDAVTLHSKNVLWPLNDPFGKNNAVMSTYSKYAISSGIRRSLPMNDGVMRLFTGDHCYQKIEMEVANGKKLIVYNVELTSNEEADTQVQELLKDIVAESASGNYIIAGGSFNKDLLIRSSYYFNVQPPKGVMWSERFPVESIPEGLTLLADEETPTRRNADMDYQWGYTYVCSSDGYIVSNNVEVKNFEAQNLRFQTSNHNPVVLEFVLTEN